MEATLESNELKIILNQNTACCLQAMWNSEGEFQGLSSAILVAYEH